MMGRILLDFMRSQGTRELGDIYPNFLRDDVIVLDPTLCWGTNVFRIEWLELEHENQGF